MIYILINVKKLNRFVKTDTKRSLYIKLRRKEINMQYIPFEKLYNTDFNICETIVKPQYWAARNNCYSCIGSPKISHTLLWFKNCNGRLTDKSGNEIEIAQNQMVYTAKFSEYMINFLNTNESKEDTYVIHFQLISKDAEDIIPSENPIICIKSVNSIIADLIEKCAAEYKKNVVCVPEIKSAIYKLLSEICQKQKRRTVKNKYACILPGIELLEENSELSIAEIAEITGVSICYFRRLFTEYSGESPSEFRQHHRIEKAKQLLLSDEDYSIGEISTILGFSDIYHFSKTFKKFCGVSPTKYIQREKH